MVVLGGAFTILEIAEVVHQSDINETGAVALAVIAGLLHASAALLAARELWAERRAPAAS